MSEQSIKLKPVIGLCRVLLVLTLLSFLLLQDTSSVQAESDPNSRRQASLAQVLSPSAFFPLVLRNYQILCNNSFESGDWTCWEHGGGLKHRVAPLPHDGSYAAELGSFTYLCDYGVPVDEAWIRQSFTVPRCTNPRLSFEYNISSHDVLQGGERDSFDVYLTVGGTSTLILRDGNTEWKSRSCGPAPWNSGWKTFSYTLSSRMGYTVTLLFLNANRDNNYYNTWTYVDNVQVTCEQ